MNLRSARTYDGGDDYGDATHHDRTLRALEGRRGDEVMQWTPPDSAGERPDGDDSGDLFLKIAREDSFQRTADSGRMHAENSNAIVSGVLPLLILYNSLPQALQSTVIRYSPPRHYRILLLKDDRLELEPLLTRS